MILKSDHPFVYQTCIFAPTFRSDLRNSRVLTEYVRTPADL